MKAIPAIIAVLVIVAIVRVRRRKAARDPNATGAVSPARPVRRPLVRANPLGDTGLVAAREVRERLRGRVFRVVTVVLFAVVAAAVVIPTIHRSTVTRPSVGLVVVSSSLEPTLQAVAHGENVALTLVLVPDLARGRADLEAGRVDVVVTARQLVVKTPIASTDTSALARYVRAVAVALGARKAFEQAGLTPAQAATVEGAKPLPVESTHPGKPARSTAQATALLGVILIFIVLTQYLTWTLMGVMEEKSNRVVEVLLSTVRPVQLLAGKVIGIGAVALAQAVALVVFALALGAAVGSDLVRGAAPTVVVSTLVWLVLGYAFYSWVYAAAGSLVERQDQVQSMALPLSAPLIFGYIVSLIGVSSGRPSLLVEVLAYLPPTAPFAMPTLVGFGEASWWQFLLSVLLSLGTTVAVALLAARVYKAAVLRTGGRVRLRDVVPARAP